MDRLLRQPCAPANEIVDVLAKTGAMRLGEDFGARPAGRRFIDNREGTEAAGSKDASVPPCPWDRW